MMHTHQWQLFGIADGFCLRHSDKQCSNKPRAVGDTDRIHIIQRHPRIRKCLSNHLIDFFNVFALSNLRNNAINSTLSRTINTSGTTLVTLLAIFFFGGETIRGFIFALIIGVVVGTAATIFLATPIAYDLMTKRAKTDVEK